MKKRKGISLIVLSITILVMAILAATVIIALEDSGIIGRSKNTVKNNNYVDEYTRLAVIKNGILTDNLGTITVDEYITELQNKGIIESSIITNADGSKTVTTKTGFTVVVSQNGTSDLGIVIDGYTPPTNSNSGSNTGNGDSEGNIKEIKFYIDDIPYFAQEGMTWQEWIDSDYDNGEFCEGWSGRPMHIETSDVIWPIGSTSGAGCLLTDKIVANGTYELDMD